MTSRTLQFDGNNFLCLQILARNTLQFIYEYAKYLSVTETDGTSYFLKNWQGMRENNPFYLSAYRTVVSRLIGCCVVYCAQQRHDLSNRALKRYVRTNLDINCSTQICLSITLHRWIVTINHNCFCILDVLMQHVSA